MKNTQFARSVMAIVLGSVLVSSSVFAEESMSSKAQNLLNSTANKVDSSMEKIDNSVKKVDAYMDDSAITAKVKSALLEHHDINSTKISVKTIKGVVTLKGTTNSAEQSAQVVKIAEGIEGVKSVSNQLSIQADEASKVESYASDITITGKAKAKLMADELVPSRHVIVKTTDGVVQLTGTVKTQAQSERAVSVVKAIEGVKSIKNDLVVKP